MEVTVLGADKAPSKPVIAVQVGSSPLRQAGVEVGRPFLVPRPGEGSSQPVEVSLFGQLGFANLPEGNSESTCTIPVTMQNGKTTEVKLRVKKSSSQADPPISPTAKMSSDYLDQHDLQVHLQGLIEEVLRVQPDDPFKYMITQLQLKQTKEGKTTEVDPAAAPAVPAVAAPTVNMVPTPPAAPKPDKAAPARPGVNVVQASTPAIGVAAPAISVTAAPPQKAPSNMKLGLCAPQRKNSKEMMAQGRTLAKKMSRISVNLAYRGIVRLEAHKMARGALSLSYGGLCQKYPQKIVSGPRENIMLIFGPPASGKGTHGQRIQHALKIPQLATGDMLREAVDKGTEIGKKAKEVMAAGALVSDEIVIGIIQEKIKGHDCRNGFVLDGFPRTVAQAKALDKMLAANNEKVNFIVALTVPDDVLIERIGGRWIHKSSGRSYHTKHSPPKSFNGKSEPSPENMKDDETGEPLMQRADDNKDALPARLKAYHSETSPILGHYGEKIATKVDANLTDTRKTENIWADVAEALKL